MTPISLDSLPVDVLYQVQAGRQTGLIPDQAVSGRQVYLEALPLEILEAIQASRQGGLIPDAIAAEAAAEFPDWPACHVRGPEGEPRPMHLPQQIAFNSTRRITAMVAGTQSGKTSFDPWWLKHRIDQRGPGDYLAVTSSFDLFKLKLLPEFLAVFEGVLGIGRFWASDRVIEVADPATGKFLASRSTDPMWARIILRSTQSGSHKSPGSVAGLESTTAKAAVLDEAGQDDFTIDALRSIRRRLALNRGDILLTTTLYNLGWVKTEIIDKATNGGEATIFEGPHGSEIEVTDNPVADILLIQFDSIANPEFSLAEFEEAERDLPNDEFMMFYRGRVAKLRFLIYDSFDRNQHTCPRFAIGDNWRRFVGLDFGGVHTAALFYAEEPRSKKLYCYREYLAGGRTAKEHAEAILEEEPGIPFCVGGSTSEDQWRGEFRAGGLPVREPKISDVDLGITRVYGCHKRDEIIYFDDLAGIIGEKEKYQRKRDASGEVTKEIKDKNKFHRIDAERYIIGGWLKHTTGKKGPRVRRGKASIT